MTAVIDLEPIVIDPPDLRVEQPPESSAPGSDGTCLHCRTETATWRFNGHHADKLLTAGTKTCDCPRPYALCGRCYVDWFRNASVSWFKDGFVTCGYCKATGKTIEDLMPFEKIA